MNIFFWNNLNFWRKKNCWAYLLWADFTILLQYQGTTRQAGILYGSFNIELRLRLDSLLVDARIEGAKPIDLVVDPHGDDHKNLGFPNFSVRHARQVPARDTTYWFTLIYFKIKLYYLFSILLIRVGAGESCDSQSRSWVISRLSVHRPPFREITRTSHDPKNKISRKQKILFNYVNRLATIVVWCNGLIQQRAYSTSKGFLLVYGIVRILMCVVFIISYPCRLPLAVGWLGWWKLDVGIARRSQHCFLHHGETMAQLLFAQPDI